MRPNRRPPLAVALLAAALLLPAIGRAQESAAFVLRIGNDTVAVERYTRDASSLVGRQVLRTPRTTIRDYVAHLDADGRVTHFEMSVSRPGDTVSATVAEIHYGADTAVVRFTPGGNSTRIFNVAAAPGSIPFVGYSVGLYELALARHLAAGGAPSTSVMVPIGGSEAFAMSIGAPDADGWVELTNIAGANRVRVGEGGRLLAWDGTGSTLKLEGERLASVDIDALAASFDRRDLTGQALGSLSPRDSIATSVGEAGVRIVYSRPSRRGRQVAGGVVPWGEVWRTGANQATVLTTDRDLMVGDAHVPAGSYSLWTLPAPTGWTLILNRQTGQWGTEYDPAQDLARVPMRSSPRSDRLEQFTISLQPQDGGGRLVLSWDDFDVWVPVRQH